MGVTTAEFAGYRRIAEEFSLPFQIRQPRVEINHGAISARARGDLKSAVDRRGERSPNKLPRRSVSAVFEHLRISPSPRDVPRETRIPIRVPSGSRSPLPAISMSMFAFDRRLIRRGWEPNCNAT